MNIDPRVVSWRKRQVEMARLEILRDARARVCGCLRCGNDLLGKTLDEQILSCEQLVAQLGNECCYRLPDRERTRAMERGRRKS